MTAAGRRVVPSRAFLTAAGQAARCMEHEAEALVLSRVAVDGRRYARSRVTWCKTSLIFLAAARHELKRLRTSSS